MQKAFSVRGLAGRGNHIDRPLAGAVEDFFPAEPRDHLHVDSQALTDDLHKISRDTGILTGLIHKAIGRIARINTDTDVIMGGQPGDFSGSQIDFFLLFPIELVCRINNPSFFQLLPLLRGNAAQACVYGCN